ncbi:MAG TPA: VIT1/CCC1 transporter family protein [Ktedonobacterales bacterium]|nr:VIT1/CCC1 transporter family protein [Ktedonobacterales bacterium]
MADKQRRASELAADHTAEAIAARLEDGGVRHPYLRDAILGAIDGCVTTFAVVAGVVGADLPVSAIVVLGMANLLADGFSMAASDFQGIRAERQVYERERWIEESHVVQIPEGEREEVRQIFARKGLAGDDLDQVVRIMTADRQRWVETMLDLEKGLLLHGPSPWRAALTTFVAFAVAGLAPLLIFLYDLVAPGQVASAFMWSALLTGVTFFAIGATKSLVVNQPWYLAGLETLAVGGTAAVIAFAVGLGLKQVGIAG